MGLMNYEVNVAPFKEPRGAIKLFQWVFAIVAFSTTAGFSTQFGIKLKCPGNVTVSVAREIDYPFSVEGDYKLVPSCGDLNSLKMFVGVSSDAQYFVCTGVLSFLYAMAAGTLYLLYEKSYQENNKVPLIDFAITLILAIFWISSVAAWGEGISTLSSSADPAAVIALNKQLHPSFDAVPTLTPTFTKLTISVLFGVINFVLWAGNLWFLYKETTWFESIMKNSLTSRGQSSSNT